MLGEVFVSYKEWMCVNGFLRKEWRNKAGYLNRESGPAEICYEPDGSIEWEAFHIAGEYLGRDKRGFWRLWEILDERQRQDPDILKYLARFS
jgi:hypothetical protein